MHEALRFTPIIAYKPGMVVLAEILALGRPGKESGVQGNPGLCGEF